MYIAGGQYGGQLVCCLLSAVCCLLSAVCCLLSAVCCLLSALAVLPFDNHWHYCHLIIIGTIAMFKQFHI
jgi:hypothetical protein